MRIEKDFLGEMELPDEAYYGVQTMRSVENFPISGFSLDYDYITAIMLVKKAAAKANIRTGRMEQKIGEAIMAACDEVIAGKLRDQFILDPIQGGAGTSINMNANEVLANRALELLGHKKGDFSILSPNDHVNMAQSTNDAIPSAIRITAINKIKVLVITLRKLADSLRAKGVEFKAVLKMGRTHLQDAVPITLGQEFNAYANLVDRSANRIEHVSECLHQLNIGATAVGTGINAEVDYIKYVIEEISTYTGDKYETAEDLVDATQNIDELGELSGALKSAALGFTKMANDLRMMASGPKCGFNEITLPPRQPGSSIMPGKINPVIPEVVNQVAFQVIGNDSVINQAVAAGQFELNVMGPVLSYNLFNSIKMLTNAAKVLDEKCVQGITANVKACQDEVDKSLGIITALIPHIGYGIASSVVKEAMKTGASVRDIIVARNIMTLEKVNKILSAEEMTTPGIAGQEFLIAATAK